MKNPSGGSRAVPCGRTDWHYCNSATVPKNSKFLPRMYYVWLGSRTQCDYFHAQH